jgi:hypothetical protein
MKHFLELCKLDMRIVVGLTNCLDVRNESGPVAMDSFGKSHEEFYGRTLKDLGMQHAVVAHPSG